MYIKPRVVVIEETQYWEESLANHAGSIYGVYLFDANRKVHCCELTASYELHPLEVAVRDYEKCSDEIRDLIESEWNLSTDIVYMHAYSVDQMPTFPVGTAVRCNADDYDEQWDEIMQSCHENLPNYELPKE